MTHAQGFTNSRFNPFGTRPGVSKSLANATTLYVAVMAVGRRQGQQRHGENISVRPVGRTPSHPTKVGVNKRVRTRRQSYRFDTSVVAMDEQVELIDQDGLLYQPVAAFAAVPVLLEPPGQSDAIPTPKTLGAVACLQTEDRDIDIHNPRELVSSVVAPRNGEPHRAADGFVAALPQIGVLDQRSDQRDAVHGASPAIRFSGMGGSFSCAGPGAFQRRPAT